MLFRDYKGKLFVDTQSVRNIYLEPSKWVKESSAKLSEYFFLLILAEFVIHTTFCNYRRKHCMPTTSFVFIAHCSFTCVALLLTLRDESTVEFQLFQTLFYIFGQIYLLHTTVKYSLFYITSTIVFYFSLHMNAYTPLMICKFRLKYLKILFKFINFNYVN